MTYELEIAEKDDFVVTVLSGVRTPETLIAAASKTTVFCKERGYSRLLIDLRKMSGGLDTLETFEVAGHGIPNQKHVRNLVRSAIVDHPENLDRIRFFETVAINRGFNVKVFSDEARAVAWLLADANNGETARAEA